MTTRRAGVASVRGLAARAPASCAAFVAFCAFSGCTHSPQGTATAPASLPAPTYVRDPSFPQPSSVVFGTVSWVRREPRSGLIYVLQRSQPAVSAWTPQGRLVSAWTTAALGDPHSISFHTGADGATQLTGGGTGSVSLFMVPMDCAQPTVADVPAFARFAVPLPVSETTTLLHALTVDPETWDVTLAVLGTSLPPQRWVATWPDGRPPAPR